MKFDDGHIGSERQLHSNYLEHNERYWPLVGRDG